MKMIAALVLTFLTLSANAAVYNCVPDLGSDDLGAIPADFFHARIEVTATKFTVDLKNEAMDAYGSCGKKIGKFSAKNIVKEGNGEVAFTKSWTKKGILEESNDSLSLELTNREIPAEMKFEYGGSCVEWIVNGTLKCTKE